MDDLIAIGIMIGSIISFGAVIFILLYLSYRLRKRSFAPNTTDRLMGTIHRALKSGVRTSVPWNGIAVLMSMIIYSLLPGISYTLLIYSGVLNHIYGENFLPVNTTVPAQSSQNTHNEKIEKSTSSNSEQNDQSPDTNASTDENRFEIPTLKSHQMIAQAWATIIACPFILFMFYLSIQTFRNPYLPNNPLFKMTGFLDKIIVGLSSVFIAIPLCYICFFLANYLFSLLFHQIPEEHPLTLIISNNHFLDKLLMFLNATIAAPALEETLLRGLLLFWMTQKPSRKISYRYRELIRPDQRHRYVLFIGFLLVFMQQSSYIQDWLVHQKSESFYRAILPILFMALCFPIYWFIPKSKKVGRWLRIRSPQIGHAIIASALCFASLHSTWPSPIPLFLLGLILGYITVRTQHLLSAYLLHFLFNTFAVILLLIQN